MIKMRFSGVVALKALVFLSWCPLLHAIEDNFFENFCDLPNFDEADFFDGCEESCRNLADPESPLFDFNVDCTSGTTITIPTGGLSTIGDPSIITDPVTIKGPYIEAGTVSPGTPPPFTTCNCPCQTCIVTDLIEVDRRQLVAREDGTEGYAPVKLTKEILDELLEAVQNKQEKATAVENGDDKTSNRRELIFDWIFDFFSDLLFGGGDDDDDDDDEPTPAPTFPSVDAIDKECLVWTASAQLEPLEGGLVRICDSDEILQTYAFGDILSGPIDLPPE